MSAKKEGRIPLAVGATVWRIHFGSPGHFTSARGMKVESETKLSWVLANGVKIPKTQTDAEFRVLGNMRQTTYCLTRAAAEAFVLVHNNQRLGYAVQTSIDPSVLRKVADALGVNLSVED